MEYQKIEHLLDRESSSEPSKLKQRIGLMMNHCVEVNDE